MVKFKWILTSLVCLISLSFANPSILNDVRFHPCVRLRLWESNQILSFVPPDGQFKLMSYRFVFFQICFFAWNYFSNNSNFFLISFLFQNEKVENIPIYVKPQLTSDSGTCWISVLVGIKNDPGKPIDSITIQFQLPPCVVASDISSNYGSINTLADKVGFRFFKDFLNLFWLLYISSNIEIFP